MTRYRQLKEAAHREVCDWMRILGWQESMSAHNLALCAHSYFRARHRKVPRFKKPTTAWNARQTVTRAKQNRRTAILFLARREIVETAHLFPKA